jgi:hypothetical protein
LEISHCLPALHGRDREKTTATRMITHNTPHDHEPIVVCRELTSRIRGLAKTHLEHIYSAVALNLLRLHAWWNGNALDRTRTTHLARLELRLAA